MKPRTVRRIRRLWRRRKASRFSKGADPGEVEGKGGFGVWLRSHGLRILLVILLAITIRLLFPVASTPEFPEFEVGMVAPKDVVSPFSYNVYKSPEELASEKEKQAGTVLPVLEFIPDVLDSALARVDRFFQQLDQRITDAGLGEGQSNGKQSPAGLTQEEIGQREAELIAWLGKEGIEVGSGELPYLLQKEKQALLSRKVKAYITAKLEKGVLTDDSMDKISRDMVTISREGKEKLQRTDKLVTQSQAFALAWKEQVDPEEAEISQSIFLDLITMYLKPNIVYNELETSRRVVQAEAEVSPIKGQVLKGEKIIEKGYRIKEEALEKFRVLKGEILAREPSLTTTNTLIAYMGTLMVNAFLLMIFGLYLLFYRRELYDSISSLLAFSLIFLLVMFPASIIARMPAIPTVMIPISLASLLIAILYDVRVAVVAILVLSILLGGQENFGYDVLFISLLGGISGGLSIRIIRKRRQLGESILYIAGGYILAILSMNMIRLSPWIKTVETCGWGGINAVLSTLVAMALLPLFEVLFNETTDLTLMELSDFNHPLLRSLVIRAPGTWAHTMGVSNLAEEAAEVIGANSLLTRVGCYYHDIGKIKKPEYFIENQSSGNNPHDHCSPSMSVMIIENHVKEGIELAKEAKLPQCIIDFIPEHHGTTKVSFFYEKARGEEENSEVNVHDYSYQGPKPRSKETAICMFADSVESMSRVLVDPSPSRIRGMVKSAIQMKIDADQLETCDLTFRDVHLIEEAFVKILLARFHSRIEYSKEENRSNEKKPPVARNMHQRRNVDGADGQG
jgi:hypothetical protein